MRMFSHSQLSLWRKRCISGGMAKVLRDKAVILLLAFTFIILCRESLAAPSMTLSDCLRKAFQLNPELLDAREAVLQAKYGITEARSAFLPNLSLDGSYNFLEKTQKVSFPDPLTGRMTEFEIDFTRDYTFQLRFSQPLYTGGRLMGSYRIANFAYQAALADLERRKSEVALNVIQAFYGLLLARESVKVARQALQTAQEFLRVVKARYETGEASSFEVLRAEVEVSNLKPALIQAKNAVALSELSLKKAIGVKSHEEVDFVGELTSETFEIGTEEALDLAFSNRPEMKLAEIQREIADQSIKVARSQRLPLFSLTANYDIRTDKITLSSDELEKTYAGYLVVSLPIFDGLRTKSQISRAYSQKHQAEISEANLRDAIELEVRSSLLEVDAALERLKSQEKNVEMATEGLKIANERYLQGYATNLEVMDAQLALTQARTNRIQALHDLNLAIAKAKKAMGALLKDYNLGAQQ